MTADVQRELAAHQPRFEPFRRAWGRGWSMTGCSCGWKLDGVTSMDGHQAAAVQRLIADAEKRAAAAALMRLGTAARVMWDGTYPVQAVPLSALLDAVALDPS